MQLETPRLTLIPVQKEDIQRLHALHSMPEIAEFNTLGIPLEESVTVELLKNVLDKDNKQEHGWTIWNKETRTFIGELGMGLSPELDRGEIHYGLMPDAWGNGYAIEAVKRIIAFGFEMLNLQKIEANTATENLRSIKLLEKVGMRKESIQQKTLLIDDEWLDNFTFSIVSTMAESG